MQLAYNHNFFTNFKHKLDLNVSKIFVKGADDIKKIWNWIVGVSLLVSFLMLAVFTVPKIFGIQSFVITSASMEPKYPVGSMIFVEKINPESVDAGDDITFWMQDRKIAATHQVYQNDTENRQFRTQGINNFDAQGNVLKDALPVDYDALIGRAFFCIPCLGSINRFCTTAPGNILLVGAAIIMSAISFLMDEKYTEKNNRMFRRKK